jgi:hypothetical protein
MKARRPRCEVIQTSGGTVARVRGDRPLTEKDREAAGRIIDAVADLFRAEATATRAALPGGVNVRAYRADAVPLVTLEDPAGPPEKAAGAFARLRPPEGTTPDQVDAWRDVVALKAIEVMVLPIPQADDVPLAEARSPRADEVGTFRAEAERLAKESGPDVEVFVNACLDGDGA